MIIDNDSRFILLMRNHFKRQTGILGSFLRVNDKKGDNNLYVAINLITKINFEYNQATVPSTVGSQTVYRFGDSYVQARLMTRHIIKCIINWD
jgi:hypothetical protein